jgi:hypothetical protein
VSAAEGCKGKVSVQFKIGKSTISRRLVSVNSECRYSSRVTFAVKRRLKGRKTLKVVTRFQGNERLLPRLAKDRTARIRS